MEINITSNAPDSTSMEVVGADKIKVHELLSNIEPVVQKYLTAVEALDNPDRDDFIAITALKLQFEAQMSMIEQSANDLYAVCIGEKTIGECGYPEFDRGEEHEDWE